MWIWRTGLVKEMKLVLMIVLIFGVGAVFEAQSNPLRIMSFNIRTELANDPGAKNWHQRKAVVLKLIQNNAPSLIGLQEATQEQHHYLQKGLGPLWASSKHQQILYRKDQFNIKSSGLMQLVEDKWGPRSAEWLLVSGINDRQQFLFINTHWGVDALSQQGSASIMSKELPKTNESWSIPTVLLGDFNITVNSDPYMYLEKNTQLRNLFYGRTFTNFSSKPLKQLDYVWAYAIESTMCKADQYQEGEFPPSDHYPLVCDISLRNEKEEITQQAQD